MTVISPNTATDDPRHQAALDWLLGRINFERTVGTPYLERQLKLDRMRQLLTRCGNPDVGLNIVHVAGTKGKGSTSAIVAAVLQAAGYRVGVFSSPHLERIEERFVVDQSPCSAVELVGLIERLQPVAQAMDNEASAGLDPPGPTYFELTTAMALQHFADQQVDVAVLEVGLGGRLDATNVCLPMASIITSISHDHTKQLGSTLAQIAREKAGIIKPGVPVISGVVAEMPRTVIAEIAREHGCRLVELERDFQVVYESRLLPPQEQPGASRPCDQRWRGIGFEYDAHGERWHLEHAELALVGRHQAVNAAVALATLLELRRQGWSLSEESIRTGLKTARLPARVECFPGQPTVIVDTAHNPASAEALARTIADEFSASRRTLVLSVSRDKDVKTILANLASAFDRFVVTEYQDNPRAVPAARLASLLREQLDAAGLDRTTVTLCPTPTEAWQHSLAMAADDELVVIAGSFFLAAELRPLVVQRATLATTSQHGPPTV